MAGPDHAVEASERELALRVDARDGAIDPSCPRPQVPAFAVPRPRLTALLDLASHQRLAIVVAPPGYGKTTLLAAWADAHPRQRIRWMQLGTEGDVSASFVADLADVLGLAGATDGPIGPVRSGSARAGRTPLLRSLLSGLERMPPTTLVIDDFQELTDPAVVDDLATLIDHAHPALRVIIATRVDLPRRFYRLGVDDALVEIRQQDLEFTSEEATVLLRRVAELDLGRTQVEQVMRRTEGWATGLQLAGLSIRGRSDVDEFVASFAEDDRHVADYLTEQVLRRQPEEVCRFLLTSSVLTRMCGALLDAVLEQSSGQAMLDRLHRHSMFIAPIDGANGWYRYHRHFRAFLRHHLHDRDPALEGDVLRRAADWYLSHDDPDTAVTYYADAGLWTEVLAVAITYGSEVRTGDQAAGLARWIGLVPANHLGNLGSGRLLEAAAWALGGDADRAVRILTAPGLGRDGSPSAGEQGAAGVVLAYAHHALGRTTDAIATAEVTLPLLDGVADDDLPKLLGLTNSLRSAQVSLQVLRATSLLHERRVVEALDALASIPAGGPALIQVQAMGGLALALAWSGRLTESEATAGWALTLAAQCGLADAPATVDAHLALVEVSRERDDLARARSHLEAARARSLTEVSNLTDTILATEEAALALAEGQPVAGLTVLATLQAHQAKDHPVLPEQLEAWRRSVETCLLVRSGDLAAATRAIELAPLENQPVAAARVAVAVERGDLRGARAVVDRWPDRPEPRAGLERRLWRAILLDLEGERRAAADELAAVLADAAVEEHLGLFRTRHVLGPARALYRTAPTPFLRRVVNQPLAVNHRGPVKGLDEQLTEREYVLLRLLPTRLSNAEIADVLGVSLNTVKTHLKHVYRKLGVADRSEAIDEAERLHLL
jgi:LuxR family maltose regulon positive regulatory protein